MKSQLILYVGNNCHLCSDAEELLKPLLAKKDLTLSKINICGDSILQDAYGLRIPVLKLRSGKEYNWPFNLSVLDNEIY